MLRICISGLSCSGKTTLGETISKELNIMHVTKRSTKTYEKVAEQMKEDSSMNLEILQTADKRYADSFDKEIVEMAKKNDCVVTTWVGPWIVNDPTIRVWLSASFDERVRRQANRNKTTVDDAKIYVKNKDELNTSTFKELYNIDIKNHSFFDMMINTERLSLNEAVSLISMLALGKEQSRFR